MSITFYYAPFSSAGPVYSALHELDVPYDLVKLDLAKGDQRTPEHLARNPNGKVPTVVIDGTPMFEACAIMQWLGDRYGVDRGLWPAADAPERLTAMAWSTWAYVTLGPSVRQIVLSNGKRVPELESQAHWEHAQHEFQTHVGILDARLAEQPYMLGDRYTLVDLIVGCVVMYGASQGGDLSAAPRVAAWTQRLQGREAVRAAFAA
ncbi:MAG: glutathione S-transferase family protein [Sandaracinaceae bacterium]